MRQCNTEWFTSQTGKNHWKYPRILAAMGRHHSFGVESFLVSSVCRVSAIVWVSQTEILKKNFSDWLLPAKYFEQKKAFYPCRRCLPRYIWTKCSPAGQCVLSWDSFYILTLCVFFFERKKLSHLTVDVCVCVCVPFFFLFRITHQISELQQRPQFITSIPEWKALTEKCVRQDCHAHDTIHVQDHQLLDFRNSDRALSHGMIQIAVSGEYECNSRLQELLVRCHKKNVDRVRRVYRFLESDHELTHEMKKTALRYFGRSIYSNDRLSLDEILIGLKQMIGLLFRGLLGPRRKGRGHEGVTRYVCVNKKSPEQCLMVEAANTISFSTLPSGVPDQGIERRPVVWCDKQVYTKYVMATADHHQCGVLLHELFHYWAAADGENCMRFVPLLFLLFYHPQSFISMNIVCVFLCKKMMSDLLFVCLFWITDIGFLNGLHPSTLMGSQSILDADSLAQFVRHFDKLLASPSATNYRHENRSLTSRIRHNGH